MDDVNLYRKELKVSVMQQGLVLMATGMAVVFAFLVILIFITKLQSKVVLKYFPEKEVTIKPPSPAIQAIGAAPVGANDGAEIAAAIVAAAAYAKR
jgi:oxaloacetate decarboxylase gamma subunit